VVLGVNSCRLAERHQFFLKNILPCLQGGRFLQFKDQSSRFPQNVGNYLARYTALHQRITHLAEKLYAHHFTGETEV
jgi:hypothetical protein